MNIKRTILSVLVIAVILFIGFAMYKSSKEKEALGPTPVPDYKDATYTIDGQKITLEDGVAETEAEPGSASKITTEYFGNEVKGDFNNDGKQDVAFLLTQESSGTGFFYYVAVALAEGGRYKGINAVFLGDRIAPQSTEFKNGEIIVNYADRRDGEPLSAEPSRAVSKYLKVDHGELIEAR